MYRIESDTDEPITQDYKMTHRIVNQDDVIICASYSLDHIQTVFKALSVQG